MCLGFYTPDRRVSCCSPTWRPAETTLKLNLTVAPPSTTRKNTKQESEGQSVQNYKSRSWSRQIIKKKHVFRKTWEKFISRFAWQHCNIHAKPLVCSFTFAWLPALYLEKECKGLSYRPQPSATVTHIHNLAHHFLFPGCWHVPPEPGHRSLHCTTDTNYSWLIGGEREPRGSTWVSRDSA